MKTDLSLDPDLNADETEELVNLARKHGFHKVASKLLGEDVEDEEEDNAFDDCGSRLPSQHSRKAVFETLRNMGVSWGE